MRYGSAAAFRQALEQRLRTRAAGEGAQLVRERKRIAFDRLLSRLDDIAPDRWLLKGGFALDLRLPDRARTTRDVDIEWQASADELQETLIRAASVVGDDFFSFAIERAGIPPERLGGALRFRVTASLADREFETFLLDVGMSPVPVDEQERLTSDLLAFAEVEPIDDPRHPARAASRGEAARIHATLRRRPAELAREGPHRHCSHPRTQALRARRTPVRDHPSLHGARDASAVIASPPATRAGPGPTAPSPLKSASIPISRQDITWRRNSSTQSSATRRRQRDGTRRPSSGSVHSDTGSARRDLSAGWPAANDQTRGSSTGPSRRS